jgi:hypothetical protein
MVQIDQLNLPQIRHPRDGIRESLAGADTATKALGMHCDDAAEEANTEPFVDPACCR